MSSSLLLLHGSAKFSSIVLLSSIFGFARQLERCRGRPGNCLREGCLVQTVGCIGQFEKFCTSNSRHCDKRQSLDSSPLLNWKSLVQQYINEDKL